MSGKQFALDAEPRMVLGKKVKRLRREGILPATVYGKGVTPFSIQLNERAFNLTYRQAGRTALVDLHVPEQPKMAAFIHAVQRHPVSRSIIHVDFRVVDLTVEITVEVPLVFVGTSPLEANDDAVLNQALNSVEVRSLPGNLPQHIDVDISVLDAMDKAIHVRDLATSDLYTIVTDGDELIMALNPSLTGNEEPTVEDAPVEPALIREDREDEDGE